MCESGKREREMLRFGNERASTHPKASERMSAGRDRNGVYFSFVLFACFFFLFRRCFVPSLIHLYIYFCKISEMFSRLANDCAMRFLTLGGFASFFVLANAWTVGFADLR